LEIPNAGGSSDISEALSMQYMYNRFGAADFIAEMDVPYWIDAKKCDFMMTVGSEWIGVSVTRAIPYPFNQDYTLERATELLKRKLYGLVVAKEAIMEEYGFSKSVLHIWCYNAKCAKMIQKAHALLITEDSYDQVHVICTINSCPFIYTNKQQ
jgi:hypothetical protein